MIILGSSSVNYLAKVIFIMNMSVLEQIVEIHFTFYYFQRINYRVT